MIELKNITKSFGNNTIFDKFNCIIESGEFLGIKGKSGYLKNVIVEKS